MMAEYITYFLTPVCKPAINDAYLLVMTGTFDYLSFDILNNSIEEYYGLTQ